MVTLMVMLFLVQSAAPPLLASTEDVAGNSDAILIDSRSLKAYEEGHIPGAVHLDAKALSETHDGVAGRLKSVEALRKMLGDAGIDPAERCIVYSSMAEAKDLARAARVFWVLEYLGYSNVAVLDGGLAKWQAEEHPIVKGPPVHKAIVLPALVPHSDRLADMAQVHEAIKDETATVVDSRSKAQFAGSEKRDYVPLAGHIPGARNVPFTEFVEGKYHTLKPAKKLQHTLSRKEGDQPVITYCNSGNTASIAYFAYRLAGLDTVSIYDGSMAEWSHDPANRVVTGTKQEKHPLTENREIGGDCL